MAALLVVVVGAVVSGRRVTVVRLEDDAEAPLWVVTTVVAGVPELPSKRIT